MKEILKAIAKLLSIKSIIMLVIVFAFIYFVLRGNIEMSIFVTIATAVINKALKSDD